MMRHAARLGSAVWLLLLVPVAHADTSEPVTTAAVAPCKIWIDGRDNFHLEDLPALSADGTRVALPERCDDPRGHFCLTIAFLSTDGRVRRRVEVTRNEEAYQPSESALPSPLRSKIEPRLARVNRLLADGAFTRLPSLELPFSAIDLNLMTMRVGDVVIHYGEPTLSLERNGKSIARLDLPGAGACSGPWMRSLHLDEKTRTLVVEFEYHDRLACSAPPPGWRVVRFP